MKQRKIISVFLALIFVLSAVASAIPVSVGAAYADRVKPDGSPVIDYFNKAYLTEQDKLKDMTLYKTQNGYRIYVEEYTGEIAFQDVETGEVIFSNPYDIGVEGNANSRSIKESLLSQIVLTYKDNGNLKTMNSYTEAAKRGQIEVKNIKNGIRMEYAIGEIMVTRLVPRRISVERFETMILDHITNEFDKERLKSFYILYDSFDPKLTETKSKEIQAKFPITRRMAIYVCDPKISQNHLKQLESIIKAYCAEYYTLDDMEQDHSDTDYVGVDIAPACFRMALEYTIENDGLSVRLPANGIRFDESIYSLSTVSLLPYMGAANVKGGNETTAGCYNKGYTFIPDGSGAIIRYKDIEHDDNVISGQVYGPDYAYITVSGGQFHHEEAMRFPVFGNVIDSSYSGGKAGQVTRNNAFVAIITEGDSMAQIVAENNGSRHAYCTAYAKFTPRPSDTYKLADAVSDANVSEHTVVSKRKYAGSYVIKYKLLSEEHEDESKNYECSYVGMAKAYRDYLTKNKILVKDTDKDVKKDIPLFIEAFGSIKAKSTFLSFPVTVDKELTTFENVMTIYDELSDNDTFNINNIKFKLTGFANGGLDSTYPAKVDWVSALGGTSGFKKLKNYAEEKGFSIYPDFDFAYAATTALFDGFSEKDDAIKTIDSRYTSRKYYDSATQTLEDDYAKAISPSRYGYFGDEFTESYSDYNVNSVSVSTLGTTLNSDFDKKDPYNREDSKQFTTELLSKLKESFGDIMTDGGNAYSLPYVNNIIGLSVDSSNYLKASQTVPFAGFVLHGFVNFTGNALNMEGDIDSSILKAIENGASIYFTLSYQNVNELKESETYNKYYSVDYAAWKDEVIKDYNIVNDALKDVQTSLLDGHEFLEGYRLPTEDELAEDKKDFDKSTEEYQAGAEEAARKAEMQKQRAARLGEAAPSIMPSNKIAKPVDYTKEATDGTKYSTNDKYKTALGTIVKETYDNGTTIYINYNSYDVIVFEGRDSFVVEALGFIKK